VSSCTVAPLLEPMDAIFLSILVEQEKEISGLHSVKHVSEQNRKTYIRIILAVIGIDIEEPRK
jgi:hypothetical protein